MESVRDHYDHFLASVYSWILGDFDAARQKYSTFFDSVGLHPGDGAIAVDLGCGPGCQALPLATAGYKVLAVDFCQPLLDELDRRAQGLDVHGICDDLCNFRRHLAGPVDLIVCMGDTLVHLPDESTVTAVIADICAALKPGGKFIYAIRDYVAPPPTGAARFIPIRASDERIFTCFVDYHDDYVHVHDILWQRLDGQWRQQVSDYRKLRLDSAWINRQLEANGLHILAAPPLDGMRVTVAESPILSPARG